MFWHVFQRISVWTVSLWPKTSLFNIQKGSFGGKTNRITRQWFKSLSLANTGPPSYSPFGLLSIFVWWLFTDQNWTWSWIRFPVFISWPYVWTSGQFQDELYSRSQGFLLFFRSVYTFFIRFCWFSQPMEFKRA